MTSRSAASAIGGPREESRDKGGLGSREDVPGVGELAAFLSPDAVGRFRLRVERRCKLNRPHRRANLAIVLVPEVEAERAAPTLRQGLATPAAPPATASPTLRYGRLEIQVTARTVLLDGVPLTLTRREFDVLAYLASHAGQVVTRDEILREVWQSRDDWQDPATVTEHVRRVRRKIEADPEHPRMIVTVRGVGYRFEG